MEAMTYQSAGVNIDAGNELVDKIKKHVKSTQGSEVLGNLGGFAGFYELPAHQYLNPVLVSCTDGVGTKLRLAIEYDRHDTIGQDCVAMSVNDCVVTGAKPLWFLDYYACGALNVDQAESVIVGIAHACQAVDVSLIGGETAEMPGMYQAGDYDLAGFCVGIVEKAKILDGQSIEPGDVLVGLPSQGFHSNGYSLIRKIIEQNNVDVYAAMGDQTLLDALICPTRLYVKQTLALTQADLIKGAAHITGGGLTENLPRVLPPSLKAQIDLKQWTMPDLFQWAQKQAQLDLSDMLKTFNCGVGIVYVVPQLHVEQAIAQLKSLGESPMLLGCVVQDAQKRIEYLS